MRVADDDPLHPLEVHWAATGQATGCFFARNIFGVAQIHRHRAGLELVGFEDEGARANVFLDLLGARGRRDTGRHDERHIAGRFAQGVQHDGARLFHDKTKGAGVRGFYFVDEAKQNATHGVTAGPALERRSHVFAGDSFAVMKL